MCVRAQISFGAVCARHINDSSATTLESKINCQFSPNAWCLQLYEMPEMESCSHTMPNSVGKIFKGKWIESKRGKRCSCDRGAENELDKDRFCWVFSELLLVRVISISFFIIGRRQRQ